MNTALSDEPGILDPKFWVGEAVCVLLSMLSWHSATWQVLHIGLLPSKWYNS